MMKLVIDLETRRFWKEWGKRVKRLPSAGEHLTVGIGGVAVSLCRWEVFGRTRKQSRPRSALPAVRDHSRGRPWIVEVQIIPKEMYELKKSCGHTGHTKCRFILEACKRARIQKAINAFAAGTSRAQQAAAASAKVESRGPCSRCGEPVLVTQERETDGTGAYFHANPADCSAATTSPGGAAGAPRLKKHVSRNAVHPTDGEAEA